MRAVTIPIMAAVPGQSEVLGRLIATAFHSLDISKWLVADRSERMHTQTGQFTLLVRHAIAHGQVHTTADMSAVAVWFPSDVPAIPGYEADLARICGPHLHRFASLDSAMHSHAPSPPHWHLAFLAVLPARQNRGIGSSLLLHQHQRLDDMGIAAYLEAGDERSARLYRRHGYTAYGEPFPVGFGGPNMYPMWRDPTLVHD
jgi:ribosomal protein S18 acetylase RimI-like enzyme